MVIIDIEQGTDDWLELRQSKITATDSSVILELNPWKSKNRLWGQKIGFIDPDEENDAMRNGSAMEEEARLSFIHQIKIEVKPCIIVSDEYHFMMASMDGLSNDNQIAVEIKCGKKSFWDAKKNIIPTYYFCQMQHQMAVCNLNYMFYYCFNGKEGILINVIRDQSFIDQMIEKEWEFYKCMINLKNPCPVNQEYELFA